MADEKVDPRALKDRRDRPTKEERKALAEERRKLREQAAKED